MNYAWQERFFGRDASWNEVGSIEPNDSERCFELDHTK